MPRFIYDPADTHRNNVLHINKQRVEVGVPFDFDGDIMADPKIQAHVARVPGRVVGGERRPCIVAVDGAPLAMPAPAEGVGRRQRALSRIAVALGLPPECDALEVAEAVEKALAAPRLDPDIPSDPRPGTLTGPQGPGVRAIQPGDPPVGPAVVGDSPPADGEPLRQYNEADLPDTNAKLDELCERLGVATTSAQRKSRAGRIEALRAAGHLAEG